jgi:broad specificity phosphatase PhoE
MPVLYLVRHGQASFGASDYDVLSPTGHKQAELVAAALVERGIRAPGLIVAGTLRRQQDTAVTAVAAAPWNGELETDPRFDEYDHLALLRSHPAAAARSLTHSRDGQSVQRALDGALLAWVRAGSVGSVGSGGRSWRQFRADVVAGQREVMGRLGRGGVGVVFTSGGVIAAVCAELLGLSAEGFVALNRVTVNTGVTKLVAGRSGTSLLSFNDHAHVDAVPELLTYR